MRHSMDLKWSDGEPTGMYVFFRHFLLEISRLEDLFDLSFGYERMPSHYHL